MGGCQPGRKVVPPDSKSDLTLVNATQTKRNIKCFGQKNLNHVPYILIYCWYKQKISIIEVKK